MVLLLQPGRLKAPVSYVCLLWHLRIISFKHAWKQRGNVPCQLSLVLICYIVMVQWLWLRTIQLQSLSGGSQYHKVKAYSSIWAFVRNISSRWVFFKLWPTVNHHEWTMNFKEFPIIVIAAVLSLSLAASCSKSQTTCVTSHLLAYHRALWRPLLAFTWKCVSSF